MASPLAAAEGGSCAVFANNGLNYVWVSFEQIVIQIEKGKLHDILEHRNQQRYRDQ